jgi:hypothetical protein
MNLQLPLCAEPDAMKVSYISGNKKDEEIEIE